MYNSAPFLKYGLFAYESSILPCRRLPINCGNILKDSLRDIYVHNLKDMRNIQHNDCKHCNYYKKCNGGSKCISYDITNKLDKADPFCPILR